MTACDRSETLFGRAWDDELTVAERDGLEAHFAACPACRREYDELARTLELVQALPRPTVDEGFALRVLAEAQRREAAGDVPRRRILPFDVASFSFGRPALAMAATFVVALGVGAFLMSRPGPAPQTVAVQSPPAATVTVPTPAPAPQLAVVTAPVDQRPVVTPVERAVRPAPRPASPGATADVPVDLDSLFDHSADVELVLDPVQLRRERGRGYTPASPAVRGEAASITF
jgi:anti-sigma factor RsiW